MNQTVRRVVVQMGEPASVLKRCQLRSLFARYRIAHVWERGFIVFPSVDEFEKFRTALIREKVRL